MESKKSKISEPKMTSKANSDTPLIIKNMIQEKPMIHIAGKNMQAIGKINNKKME